MPWTGTPGYTNLNPHPDLNPHQAGWLVVSIPQATDWTLGLGGRSCQARHTSLVPLTTHGYTAVVTSYVLLPGAQPSLLLRQP